MRVLLYAAVGAAASYGLICVLLLRARSDALISALTPSLRHTLLVPGATHNDVSLSPVYYPALREFLYRAP